MKYKSIYPITCATMDAQYRLTVDGVMTFHENTVAKYLTTLNLAAFDLQKQDKTWIISEINLDLKEIPAVWPEDIEITIWPSELSALRLWFDFTAREVHGGRTIVRGNSCWSVMSFKERKIVSCSELFPASEIVDELVMGPHRRRPQSPYGSQPVATLDHTINMMDLDMNYHTNNRHYVSMALNCLPQRLLDTHRPDSLNIRFIHETLLGDALTTESFPIQGEDPEFFGLIKRSDGQEICRVNSHWKEYEPLPDICETNLIRNPLPAKED